MKKISELKRGDFVMCKKNLYMLATGEKCFSLNHQYKIDFVSRESLVLIDNQMCPHDVHGEWLKHFDVSTETTKYNDGLHRPVTTSKIPHYITRQTLITYLFISVLLIITLRFVLSILFKLI